MKNGRRNWWLLALRRFWKPPPNRRCQPSRQRLKNHNSKIRGDVDAPSFGRSEVVASLGGDRHNRGHHLAIHNCGSGGISPLSFAIVDRPSEKPTGKDVGSFLGCRHVRKPGHHCRRAVRSEEHTSELQSRENLVCRLLLEKKKQ